MIFKNFILIVVLIFSSILYSQDKENINGEWKVISIDNREVYINTKTDSISTTTEFDRRHSTKVSHQDGIAEIRAFSSHNEFIFTKEGKFYLYLDYRRKENTLRLSGTYEIIDQKNMNLKVKARTKRIMNKKAEYDFMDEKLIFKFRSIASRNNEPTIYILEKIK